MSILYISDTQLHGYTSLRYVDLWPVFSAVDINGLHILRPEQNEYHFADIISRLNSLNQNNCILIRISLKFVPGDTNDNESHLA